MLSNLRRLPFTDIFLGLALGFQALSLGLNVAAYALHRQVGGPVRLNDALTALIFTLVFATAYALVLRNQKAVERTVAASVIVGLLALTTIGNFTSINDPAPTRPMNGTDLFWVLVFAAVLCGPLLTWRLRPASPKPTLAAVPDEQ